MRYVGKWVFHSIGMVNDSDEMVYLRAEEYLKAPMPYVDESDEEAVADEMKERRQMIGDARAILSQHSESSLYDVMNGKAAMIPHAASRKHCYTVLLDCTLEGSFFQIN